MLVISVYSFNKHTRQLFLVVKLNSWVILRERSCVTTRALICTVRYSKSVKNSWDISQMIISILQLIIKFNDHFKRGGSRGRQLAGDHYLTTFPLYITYKIVVLSIFLIDLCILLLNKKPCNQWTCTFKQNFSRHYIRKINNYFLFIVFFKETRLKLPFQK